MTPISTRLKAFAGDHLKNRISSSSVSKKQSPESRGGGQPGGKNQGEANEFDAMLAP
jgi:hypothetical protein